MPNKSTTIYDGPFTHISKVGIEFEGAWETRPNRSKHDGSVNFDGDIRRSASHVGEVDSPPISDHERLEEFFEDHHPEWVNDSCGMHFHVSFPTTLHYSVLADDKFPEYFKEEMRYFVETRDDDLPTEDKDNLLDRLGGNNSYCSDGYTGDQVLKEGRGGRYYAINYAAYYRYRTYECRVLPMFHDTLHGFQAVSFALGIFDQYLVDRLGDDPVDIDTEEVEYSLSI